MEVVKEIDPWEDWEIVDECVHILGTDIFVPIEMYMDLDEAHATAVEMFESQRERRKQK